MRTQFPFGNQPSGEEAGPLGGWSHNGEKDRGRRTHTPVASRRTLPEIINNRINQLNDDFLVFVVDFVDFIDFSIDIANSMGNPTGKTL
jgi:hypothetical protein